MDASPVHNTPFAIIPHFASTRERFSPLTPKLKKMIDRIREKAVSIYTHRADIEKQYNTFWSSTKLNVYTFMGLMTGGIALIRRFEMSNSLRQAYFWVFIIAITSGFVSCSVIDFQKLSKTENRRKELSRRKQLLKVKVGHVLTKLNGELLKKFNGDELTEPFTQPLTELNGGPKLKDYDGLRDAFDDMVGVHNFLIDDGKSYKSYWVLNPGIVSLYLVAMLFLTLFMEYSGEK